MSDSAAVGVGPSIEYKGTRYPLSPMTLEMLGEFSEFAADFAWRTVSRTRKFCTPEEYAERMESTTRLINSGAYHWNTPRGQEVLGTLEGKTFEMWLRMREKTPGATLELARRIIDEKLEEALAKMAQADHDPNPGKGSEPSQEEASTQTTQSRAE